MDMDQLSSLATGLAGAKDVATATAPWWGPSGLQLLGTLVGSIGGVWIGATLVSRREGAAREHKRIADALYLAVTISAVLERFASCCADVASDDGTDRGRAGPNGELRHQVETPTLDFADIEVVWMALPGTLLDQIYTIPRRLENIVRYLDSYALNGGEDDSYFSDRRRKFAELGLEADAASRALRLHSGLSPEIDPTSNTVPWLKEMVKQADLREKAYLAQQNTPF